MYMYVNVMYRRQEKESEFAKPTFGIYILTFRTQPTEYFYAALVTKEVTLRLLMVKVTSVYNLSENMRRSTY